MMAKSPAERLIGAVSRAWKAFVAAVKADAKVIRDVAVFLGSRWRFITWLPAAVVLIVLLFLTMVPAAFFEWAAEQVQSKGKAIQARWLGWERD